MSVVNEISGLNRIEYPEQTGAATGEPSSGIDFSAMIAEALKEEATRMSVAARTSSLSSLNASGGSGMPMQMQMQGQGLEQMILAAASSGEVSDAQVALFMLCMMMHTSENSDFSMMMQMMASMIEKMQDDSDSLRNSVMGSGYDPYILDTIDWGVFGNAYTGFGGAGGAVLPLETWRPATPIVTSSEDDRSAALYTSVIKQFRVETAERYRPYRNGYTYCNIYMWDVTKAMGAEIPHYIDPATGEPREYPDVKGAMEMNARATDDWLMKYGDKYGWIHVDPETAQRYANEGKPAVTTGGTLDHVQVVCPSANGEYDPVRGVTVAQAGSIVTSYRYIKELYSSSALNNHIKYWVHE